MPALIVAAGVGAGVATVAGVALGTVAVTAAATYFATTFATTLVLGAVSQALAKKPDLSSITNQGQTVSSRSPIAAHNVVYGRTRVGGTILYMGTTDSNKYLHIVIAIAGHEIDAVEQTFANDEALTLDGNGFTQSGSTYGNKIRCQFSYGDHTTQPFQDLVTETSSLSDSAWTNNHLVRGSALAYIRLEYNQDKFPNGVPNFSFKIRGKKVYDPRTTSTAWSANPALCLNDYLTSTRYGLGCVYADEIDSSALVAAANVCDEDVNLDAGGTENRYECHGVFSTGNTPNDVINKILSSMAGKAVWSGGRWKIIPGVYYTPEVTFDESDLRAGIRVQTLISRRESFNAVKGVFSSSDENYVVTDFPQIVSDTAVNEDGEEVFKSIELPFTTSSSMAQRLAKIELLKARQQITTTLPLKLQGLKASVGDIINVNNTRLGWSSKKFEVVGINLSVGEIPGVDLELREISTDVFDWSTSEEQAYDPAPNTNLPNPFSVATVTDLALEATNVISPDGTAQSGLLVTWTPPSNAFVGQYEVQYIRGASNFDWGSIVDSAVTSNDFGSIAASADSSADYGSVADATAASEIEYNTIFVTTPYFNIIPAIAGAEYAVRVRAINALGVRSAFVTSNEITYGDQDAPDVPSAVAASGGYRQITVTWVNPTVSDFDYVEVWRNNTNTTSGATRVAVLRGSMFVDAPLAINVTRYYFLRSVDRTRNISGFTAGVSATTEFVDSDSFSAEVLNLFTEAGAYGIEPVATLPETGDFDGQIKYDTTNNKLWRWDATAAEWTDDIFSIESGSVDEASFASGIEPVKIVSELPNPSGYTGAKVVFLTTDNKLYRYDGSAWVTGVSAGDIDGTLGADNFSQDLRPVERVSALPASGNFQGRVVVLTTDNKLYRYTGTGWTAAVPSSDISGTLSAAQIDSVTAAQVTGQLTNDQIEEVAAAKLTGQISGTQIADAAISAVKIASEAVTTAKIAVDAITSDVIAANAITSVKINTNAISADKIADDAVTSAKIASEAVTTAKIAVDAITTDLIAADSITETKITDSAITTAKINAGAITTAKISAGAVTATEISAGAVTADALAANSVTAVKISASAVTSEKIDAAAVTAAKIDAGAVTTEKIDAGAITANEIASNAITSVKIDAGAITTAKIAAGAVTADEIASNAVTAVKINADAVTAEKIAASAVTADKIDAAAVTAAKIDAGAVTTAKLAAGAVTADTIAANAVTTAKIDAGAITTAKISAGAITADELAANAVTANKIAANAITTDKIDANAITSAKIEAGAIGTDQLAANSITSAKIDAGAIGTDQLAANAVTAGKITAGAIGTDQLAANAITAEKINAEAITSEKIKAGDIQGDRIAANTITGGLIAASGIITSAAQINDAVITNAKIQNAAVDTLKIASNAVTVPSSESLATDFEITANVTDNPQTVLSFTTNTEGQPIYILCDIAGWKSSSGFSSLIFYIYVNGTEVYSATQYQDGTQRRVMTVLYKTPPSGNFTVSLRAKKFADYGRVLSASSQILLGNGGSTIVGIGTKR